MSPSRQLSVLLALLAAACQRSSSPEPREVPSAATTTAAVVAPPPASAAATGAPLARLVPPSRPGPRAGCPFVIDPGVGLGPVLLGETLSDLQRAGLTIESASDTMARVAVKDANVTLRVELCQGKVISVALDDLRKGPSCATYAGQPVATTIPRTELEQKVGGCEDTPPRTGGSFERCQGGGLYVGHGLGDFLQLHVQPKGFPFDRTCAYATDDGGTIDLSPEARVALLKKVLLLRELSPYWHVDRPGRDPLRIVKTPLVRAESLTMFGSPVVWIEEAEATPKTAFLRLTRLDASKTRATVEFAYPVEGVQGVATFERIGDEWVLQKASVAER